MISPNVWETGLGLLGEYFKELSAPLAAVYGRRLIPVLDDVTFPAAVEYLIAERSAAYGYVPSIREILDAAGAISGSVSGEAAQRITASEAIAWLWNHPESSPTHRYVSEHTAAKRFGTIAGRALLAVGGGTRVLSTSPEWFPKLRTEYVDAWLAYWTAEQAGETMRTLAASHERTRIASGMEPVYALAGRNYRTLAPGAPDLPADLPPEPPR